MVSSGWAVATRETHRVLYVIDHLVAFFKRCVQGLAPGGWIGVKENNSSKGYLVDEEDSSVTR
jgi:hypothetical protein